MIVSTSTPCVSSAPRRLFVAHTHATILRPLQKGPRPGMAHEVFAIPVFLKERAALDAVRCRMVPANAVLHVAIRDAQTHY